MTMQNYFVLTATQRSTAMAMNNKEAGIAVNPPLMDNDTPGVGVNLNPDAKGRDVLDAVTLTNHYVLPKRIVDDPEYSRHMAALKPFLLSGCPWCSLEDETVFARRAGPGGR